MNSARQHHATKVEEWIIECKMLKNEKVTN